MLGADTTTLHTPDPTPNRAARDILRQYPPHEITHYFTLFFNDTAPLIKVDPSLPRFSAMFPSYLTNTQYSPSAIITDT